MYENKQHCVPVEKYRKDILRAEAKIAECLQELFCEGFVEDLKKVEPIEKRAILTHKVVCAYACKEKAMADLIRALKLKNYPRKRKDNKCDFSFNNILLVIIAIVVFYSCLCKRNCYY